MRARRAASSRVAAVLGAAGLAVLLVGCSSHETGDVASLDGDDAAATVQGGYADENTASYADCLEGLGLTVHAEPSGNLKGFVVIEGVQILGDSDTSPIGVDGVDRDADIKGCRTKFPGAKDELDTSVAVDAPQELAVDDDVAEAGHTWAQCARDAGYAMIADPVVDLVVIPEGLTVDQAVALGKACSKPIAHPDDPAPHFDYQAAVKVEGMGMDIGPYMQAIENPIYAGVMGGATPGAAAPSDGSTDTP
ncbi:hypothetical protein [Cellulomonas sp. URHB0016]